VAAQARARGLYVFVDGAHAPGQLDLDLASLGVDAYFGNLHKWLNTPKGTGFLWVDPRHASLAPLVAGWGWGDFPFVERHQRWGTRDLAGFLSVPAALAYHRTRLTASVRASCRELAGYFLEEMGSPGGSSCQMGAARLPDGVDCEALKARLSADYGIEIPVYRFAGGPWVRLSCQAYNSREEVDYLLSALRCL
jgi:isopenicillin-N epimerase